jgi:hypothetical protein
LTFRYRALGLDIVAGFALPGFWPVDRATTGREIEIDLGPVPSRLDAPVCDRPLLQIDATGAALFRVPGVARYFLNDLRRVTMELAPGANLERALDFFKGTPLALLCHQWGLTPLNGVCLACDDGALLVAGGPGCGKSTLALALAARGFRLMSDGLCAPEGERNSPPAIWPAFPEVKAWPDSLQALNLPRDGEPNAGGRHTISAAAWFEPAPRPVMAIVKLQPARGGIAERVTRRRGAAAFEIAMNLQSLSAEARVALPGVKPMQAIGRLAARAAVYEAWYPAGLDRLASLPDWLLTRFDLAAPVRDGVQEAECA